MENKKYYLIAYKTQYYPPTFYSEPENAITDVHPLVWQRNRKKEYGFTSTILWFTEISEEIALQELS